MVLPGGLTLKHPGAFCGMRAFLGLWFVMAIVADGLMRGVANINSSVITTTAEAGRWAIHSGPRNVMPPPQLPAEEEHAPDPASAVGGTPASAEAYALIGGTPLCPSGPSVPD